jgi:hypothetical protein
LVFDYVTIKAQRERSYARTSSLVDFNSDRPFDPIERWHRFNLRGTS